MSTYHYLYLQYQSHLYETLLGLAIIGILIVVSRFAISSQLRGAMRDVIDLAYMACGIVLYVGLVVTVFFYL